MNKFSRRDFLIFVISVGITLSVLGVLVYGLKYRQLGFVRADGLSVRLIANGGTSFKTGDEFNVDVYIDTKGAKVTGSDLRIRYDQSILDAESIQPGDFLPVVFVPGVFSQGIARIVLASSPNAPKSGNGILTTIKFKVIGPAGKTTISFGPATALSVLGQPTNAAGTLAPLDIEILVQNSDSPNPSPSTNP